MRLKELRIPLDEIEFLLDQYVYNVRNKTIFLQKLEGYTYEELADMYKLTAVRIKGIVKECYDIISMHF